MLSTAARTRAIVAAGIAGVAVWPLLPVHPPLVCPLRVTTGIPCPLCGITRACTAAVRGDLAASVAYNPAGILVIVAAVALLVRPALASRMLHPPVPLIAALLGGLWVWNVGFNPTFGRLLAG
ncbi:MAG: DUF2752 domain-containing protein [Actinomycetota bacterium]